VACVYAPVQNSGRAAGYELPAAVGDDLLEHRRGEGGAYAGLIDCDLAAVHIHHEERVFAHLRFHTGHLGGLSALNQPGR
jgi:hypothetical protein